MSKPQNFLSYYFLRLLGIPLSFLPYRYIHTLGKFLGNCTFLLSKKHKKRVMNNLALAKDLQLSEKQMHHIARESFQNLVITSLEYFRLPKSLGQLDEIIVCKNPELPLEISKEGKGFILVSSHQANWEIPFLDITRRHQGLAIGRPIKNQLLYNWILSLREMNGGKIITPKKAISTAIKTLQKGHFVGMLCDQALPESSYSYPFFGTRAWSSPSPALLSYKTGAPLCVVQTQRKNHRYHLHYSPPIWPDTKQPLKKEVSRLMDCVFKQLEVSIRQTPGQYLWQHKRYKQAGINHVQKQFRHDFIACILPKDSHTVQSLLPHFHALNKIYPLSSFTFFVHRDNPAPSLPMPSHHVIYYEENHDLFIRNWSFQMLLDFTQNKALQKHYAKLGVSCIFDKTRLRKYAKFHPQYKRDANFSELFEQAFLKPKP